MRLALLLVALLAFVGPAACDSEGASGPVAGTLTLTHDQGVDFHTGRLVDPGNFANSDLYATNSGSGLKLATGGDNPTVNRPVNWFLNAGGLHRVFESLAAVPDEPPTEDMTDSLVKAKTGNGFIATTHRGALVRGWVSSADTESVTLVFEPYVPVTE